MTEWLTWFDHHEGSGTWLAAIGTFLAVLTSLALALGGWARDRSEHRQRERERLSVTTSRLEVHGCLQLAIVYRPVERQAGLEARVSIIEPDNAYLMEAVRRTRFGAAVSQVWVEVKIGKVDQLKELAVPLGWRTGDPDDALRGAVFVSNGPGDDLTIDSAHVRIAIVQAGSKHPLTTVDRYVSPMGESPAQRDLERAPI